MKRCGRCGQIKPVGEFNWRYTARGIRDNYCRPCRAAYKQEHYQANKARYIKRAAARRERVHTDNLKKAIDYFKTHPCVDCGETDPLVLEFDHLRDKSFALSQGMIDKSWDAILVEIAKCEVVCANCHRRRTLLRGGFRRTRV
jgi:hypothetical protein